MPDTGAVKVLDGAAVVHMVKSTKARNFDQYVSIHIVFFIRPMLAYILKRADKVWDKYLEKNLIS